MSGTPAAIPRPCRVVVVGAGVCGLAAAHRVLERARELHLHPAELELTLLEASDRVGGIVGTRRHDGYLVEHGPDNFITNKPWALDLARRLGLADQVQHIQQDHRRALILCKGRLRTIPEGFQLMAPTRAWPVISTPILSPLAKLRLALERFIPAGREPDESLASFATRRFGREAFERLIQPLVGGIYAADPAALSMAAALPQFLEMERAPGHVTGALRRQARQRAATAPRSSSDTGVRYSLFATFHAGMGALPEALARALGPSLRLRAPVDSIAPAPPESDAGRWRVRLRSGEACPADWLVLATPARVSAELLKGVAPAAAAGLTSIPLGSAAVVYLAYPRDRVLHPLDAAGFVVPHVEGRSILAATFCSSKYAGRAPAGKVLLRAFVGGALQGHLLERSDDELAALAQGELTPLLGLQGPPDWTFVSRYPDAMPQYTLGHLARTRSIHDAMKPLAGLLLATNALDGVGIPDCVRSGEIAGDRVALSPHQTAPTGGDRHANPRHR